MFKQTSWSVRLSSIIICWNESLLVFSPPDSISSFNMLAYCNPTNNRQMEFFGKRKINLPLFPWCRAFMTSLLGLPLTTMKISQCVRSIGLWENRLSEIIEKQWLPYILIFVWEALRNGWWCLISLNFWVIHSIALFIIVLWYRVTPKTTDVSC